MERPLLPNPGAGVCLFPSPGAHITDCRFSTRTVTVRPRPSGRLWGHHVPRTPTPPRRWASRRSAGPLIAVYRGDPVTAPLMTLTWTDHVTGHQGFLVV